jgi:coproporphyrinogen III oxidase
MAATLIDDASSFFRELQLRITGRFEALEPDGRFREDPWQREGGGGGKSRVLEGGTVFEKAGVNWSDVEGELPAELGAHMPGDGPRFRATGVSLVIHPRSPRVPTVHANFRCIQRGARTWFGGGADLTPYYPVVADVVHFHRTLKAACDRHDPAYHPAFKAWADRYFYLPHRHEARGVGGTFFDWQGSGELARGDLAGHRPIGQVFDFVRDHGAALVEAYVPIVERRQADPWGERERSFQTWRRGRYVEFNLIHDRGTIFGLKTGGRTESILMSLPPVVEWRYDWHPDPGSPEAAAMATLVPRDWLAGHPDANPEHDLDDRKH